MKERSQELLFSLQVQAYDQVVEDGVAYGEVAVADDFEALAGVESEGFRVVLVDAEEEARCGASTRFGDGVLHEGVAEAGFLVAGQNVNAQDLEVGGRG